MLTSYIGLGSNIGGPGGQVLRAVEELASLAACRLAAASSLYRSRPLGPQDQPDFVNAVIALETSRPPFELLDELQRIEADHGRVRQERWGPRTLDLDLLIFGEEQIDAPDLKVPHPELEKRSFVLIPLLEIAPGLDIPGRGKIDDLVRAINTCGLEKLPADEYDSQ